MAASIVQLIAAIVSWLAAKGIDSLIGKWAAYFTIAWEKSSNEKMRVSFSETVDKMKIDLPAKHKDWEAWRKSRGTK